MTSRKKAREGGYLKKPTPDPEKGKSGWGLVKKISLILGIILTILLIIWTSIQIRNHYKEDTSETTPKQLETPKIEDETTTEIKTSGASSPAIITSGPNSSVSVLYKDGNVQISKNIEALNELVVQGRKISQVYPGSLFSYDDTDFQKWKHTCLVFLKMTVPNVYQDFLEATKLSNKPEDFPQFEIPRAIEKGIAVLEGCKLSLVNILRHDN